MFTTPLNTVAQTSSSVSSATRIDAHRFMPVQQSGDAANELQRALRRQRVRISKSDHEEGRHKHSMAATLPTSTNATTQPSTKGARGVAVRAAIPSWPSPPPARQTTRPETAEDDEAHGAAWTLVQRMNARLPYSLRNPADPLQLRNYFEPLDTGAVGGVQHGQGRVHDIIRKLVQQFA